MSPTVHGSEKSLHLGGGGTVTLDRSEFLAIELGWLDACGVNHDLEV